MKIIGDENILTTTVTEWYKQRYDVLDIRKTSDQGLSDQALWQKVDLRKRLLITTDNLFLCTCSIMRKCEL